MKSDGASSNASETASGVARTSEGAGPWLRIQLKPFALLIVSHRAEHKNFRYVATRDDVEALDQKLLRAVATELVGLGRKFSSRTELIDEMWRRVVSGFETAASSQSRSVAAKPSDSIEAPSPPNSESRANRSALVSEIDAMRTALNAKLAELRAIDGPERKGGSETVDRVVALLCGSGVTKSELVAQTGAKKGYVDALLSRILPARGYSISSSRPEGSREKHYRAERTSPGENA